MQKSMLSIGLDAVSILNTISQPCLVLDEGARVIIANQAFCETFQVKPGAAEHTPIYELADAQWDIPELRALVVNITTKNTPYESIEVTREFPTIGSRVFRLNARRIYTDGNHTGKILLRIEDITMQRSRENELSETITALANAMPGIARLSPSGQYLTVNKDYAAMLGYVPTELIGQPWEPTVHPEDREKAILAYQHVLDDGKGEFEARGIRKDGSIIYKHVLMVKRVDQQEMFLGHHCFMRDISERKRVEHALYAEKERAEVTLRSIGDAVITTDAKGVVEFLNPVAEELTGWTLVEAKGKALDTVFQIIDRQTRERAPSPILSCLTKDCTQGLMNDAILISRSSPEYGIQSTVAPIRDRDGEILGSVLIFKDTTEGLRLAQELTYQATHDGLTNLVNRREFERRTQRLLDSVRADQAEHALCYLDLDEFKVINDTCGHAAGDELLRQLGQLLGEKIRDRDTLARLGGDEFGVLMEHCTLEQAGRVASTVHRAIEDFRFQWEDKVFNIGVSIGLVPITSLTGSVGSALGAADSACYAAKDAGRNRIHVYHPNDQELAKRHGEMQWVVKIQQALAEDHFRLYFQPILPINPAASRGGHFELLLRLESPGEGIVSPGVFLSAAERYNLATKIDYWVVNAAFQWLESRTERLTRLDLFCINLSGRSLGDELFLRFLIGKFDKANFPPKKICFEITETAAIANLTNASRFIKTLKEMGCKFALDDFGSGLSSYGYLKNLPVDYLKIDGVFVKDIVNDPLDRAMVKSINEIGHIMGLQTIAEFVENDNILKCLQNIGIDFAQGFGVGRPQPIEDFDETQFRNDIFS